jgi:hypothetical protein
MTSVGARVGPWLVLGVALTLATMPVWRLLIVGFNPTLDDLLSIVCSGSRG